MGDYEKQKSLYADVQRALWTEWDPIGVNAMDPPWPSDEYDGYAAAVLHALNTGSGEDGLAKVLQALEIESMEMHRPYADVLEAARRIRSVLDWHDPSVSG